MKLRARGLLAVAVLVIPGCTWCESLRAPGCTWYESLRAKFNDGSKPGPVRAVLKGEYDRRTAPGEQMQSMMPRDYYR